MATRFPEPVSHEATRHFNTLILSREMPGIRGGLLPDARRFGLRSLDTPASCPPWPAIDFAAMLPEVDRLLR